MELSWKYIFLMYQDPVMKEKHFTQNSARNPISFMWHYYTPTASPLTLHQSMFTKSIRFLASKEQAERWLPLVDNLNMLGCYC